MEISKIRALVERAISDGQLTRDERDDIQAAIYSDHKVSPEECELWRQVQEKIWRGEIRIGG
ncbi:hypothetical protein PN462_00405 [Spirulina sp. CS-785/01]|uniref:hypothetical protein n=1 Tax=Spirulina sp. CS-785/01 TaxID=3021716 RepID=UPI00232B8098|nr:hypothetical protein [Spirulina sp. CS-785/01]MDB9311542.1 hypothetical protein [Spirulina sp. CS-785/01]